jgi:hypothetical protein
MFLSGAKAQTLPYVISSQNATRGPQWWNMSVLILIMILPVIAMILGMVGIPPAGVGLILGVDRFLDMCRTTLNVTGDLVAAVVVSRGEKPAAS